ncbi:hypothetical protein CDD82_2769 [Ophiocordyceps australis]|uniref:Uncharacterized protein n=1 Tax=Ophiocordyceps australis TaxID=1399860 RepID=A0A2C5ZD10_9HYPO|nr:hypothetical protein CDD82_2769 [Ophiocordyceps australis]
MNSLPPNMTTTSQQHQVYLGIWTDWSRGSVMGSTLTLKKNHGSFLTAFTAFFVGLIGASFWRILVLLIHRLYSTPAPRDALHHQRQVLLRNSSTAPTSLWAFVRLWWAWRSRARRIISRTLPVILCAVFCIFAFAVASGFSSKISTGIGNAVLLKASRCGPVLFFSPQKNVDEVSAFWVYLTRMVSDAANYAQKCYEAQGASVLDCTTFVKRRLPTNINVQAPCPFGGGICRSNTSNIELDTGYLNSHEHLGINFPPEKRILFRHVLKCAPLQTSGYFKHVNTPYGNITQYHYGPNLIQDSDYTIQAPTIEDQYQLNQPLLESQGHLAPDLIIEQTQAMASNHTISKKLSQFDPIPQLVRPDGDVFLFFLMGGGVQFIKPTADPWYRATIPIPGTEYNSDNSNSSSMAYRPEDAASPLGCLKQYQFCNAFNRCGLLAGYHDAKDSAQLLFDSLDPRHGDAAKTEYSPFDWFRLIFFSGTVVLETIVYRGKSLQSQQMFMGDFVGSLPDNQWQHDVTHWWNTALAAIQDVFVLVVSGSTDPLFAKLNDTIIDEPYICRHQVLAPAYALHLAIFEMLI